MEAGCWVDEHVKLMQSGIANRIEVSLGWRGDDWVRSWFISYTSSKEDGLCFLDRGLGSGDLGKGR